MASISQVLADPLDGLPAMIVGRWVREEKHRIIQRYIDASWAARQRFPYRAYVDLFAGTGRVNIKHTETFADGGPIAAWRMAQVRNGAFTSFYIADANQEYLGACEARLQSVCAPVAAYHGYAHATVDMILPQLQRNGLHFALLDPFNAGHLHFSIIEKLATLPRIDIAVHLSTGDIQRNIAGGINGAASPLDNFAPGWRDAIRAGSSKHEMREQFIDHWKNLIAGTGLNVCGTMYPVRNSKRSIMYWLCLLSRNQLADRLWRDACNLSTRSLF